MRNRLGQTIVEVMMAVAIGVVALVALVQLSNKTVVSNGIAKRVTEAHDLATQAMELIRTTKSTTGWQTFRTTYTAGSWCFNGTAVVSGSNCVIGSSVYSSDVDFVFSTSGANEQVVATVTVSWIEGSQTKTAVVETIMTKY